MQRVVLVGLVFVGCNACFDVEPPPPPPVDATGVIAGTINVDRVTGAAARDPGADARARAAVARADGDVGGAAIAVSGPGDHVPPAPPDRRVEKEFRSGEALVLFERKAQNKQTIGAVLEAMKHDAGFDDVEIRVDSCKFRRVCKLTLIDDKGFLDEQRTSEFVAAMTKQKRGGIELLEENITHHGFLVPNDPLASLQWHYEAIKLPAAWDITRGDPDLVVAVVDTGVKHAHPDLRAKLARDPNNFNQFVEFDFVSTPDLEGDDIAGVDLDAEDPGDDLFGTAEGQDSFHGTHVAGTIGAVTNNAAGVAGVLWDAQIVPVRVLGKQLSGNFDDILNGLAWAIGDTDPEFDVGQVVNQRPARVVNLSLGAVDDGSATRIWEAVVDEILDDPDGFVPNDVVMVCAAGNAAQDARQTTPANVPRMITVGATRFDGVRADYSNFGSPVDVMAPGGQQDQDLDQDGNPDMILSTWDTDVKLEQGTSMAAPHVSGVAGLLLAAKPTLTHDLIQDVLKTSANGAFRCNEGCGNGLVDAVQALLLAGAELDPAPRLSVDTQRLFFPGGIGRLSLRVLNLGNVAASFTTSFGEGDADLFAVSPGDATIASGGNVTLTVDLARGDEDAGAVELKITGTGESEGQEIIVVVFFDDNPARPLRDLDVVEVGAFFRNAEGELVAAGKGLAERDAGFAYAIEGLKAGVYEVYAVGDDNHDGTFDSQLESFGAYPLTDGVQPVVLEKNDTRVDGIDFGVTLKSDFSLAGGVGAPCTADTSDADCAGIDFAPGAGCIDTFPGGYCSRICDGDALCGVSGQCETLECDGQPCNVCLQRCVSDVQCRDGYRCDFGSCAPVGFGN